MKTINTVTGTITTDKLGTTLMHEHLLVGWARMGTRLQGAALRAQDRAQARGRPAQGAQDLGLSTFVDPCPNDIGRDVVFMAEVGRRQRRQRHLRDRTLQRGPRQHAPISSSARSTK